MTNTEKDVLIKKLMIEDGMSFSRAEKIANKQFQPQEPTPETENKETELVAWCGKFLKSTLITGGIMWAGLFLFKSAPKAPTDTRISTTNKGRMSIMNDLKDPDSYKELNTVYNNDGSVTIEFTATNSFGARVRGQKTFK